MHADLESIVCKFVVDPAICLREEAICAKVYRQTDDGCRAIALAHSWNELKTVKTDTRFYRAKRSGARYSHDKLSVRRSVRLSLRPSLTLVDCDHTRWNSSKIISRMISLGT